MLAAFDQSDMVALLATLDIPALKNLKLTLETLDLLNYPRDRWRIVLNRADSKVGLPLNEVEKTLKTPIVGQIPSVATSRHRSTAACRSCSTTPSTRVSPRSSRSPSTTSPPVGASVARDPTGRDGPARLRRKSRAPHEPAADPVAALQPCARAGGRLVTLADRLAQARRDRDDTFVDARRAPRARREAATRSPSSSARSTRRCSTTSAPSSTTRG